jgi:hypothetical protein
MLKHINQPTNITTKPTIQAPSDDYCPWEEELRQKVRKEYFSELGQKQKDCLNPELLKMIEDFISGKDISRFDYLQEWTKPATEHWEIDLQTYFNDEYLKEIGLYDSAIEAREEYEQNKDEYLKADLAHETEMDRTFYRERYEAKESKHRRDSLNLEYHRSIREYLYNNGEAPRLIDCFDAPIKVLREYGILEEVLNERAIKEEKAYQELLKIAAEL